MKKLKKILLIVLILGLYFDIRVKSPYVDNEPSVCNGDYRQRAILVQMIVPFRPERESFYLAWGNKHYELETNRYTVLDRKTGIETSHISYSGCASYRYGFGRHTHLIDLRKWF